MVVVRRGFGGSVGRGLGGLVLGGVVLGRVWVVVGGVEVVVGDLGLGFGF